jgi:subtilisin family serine protease
MSSLMRAVWPCIFLSAWPCIFLSAWPCIFLSALAPVSPARAQSIPEASADVGPAVRAALGATGQARVLITLRDPVALTAAVAVRQAAVAAAQDAVVARLPDGDFTLVHRYRNVPGLAAIVTASALDLLRTDPRVASIQVDEPGGAHLTVSVPALRADVVHGQLGITGQGVTVAVLDTGVDTNDAELTVVGQQCFTQSACQPGNTSAGPSAQDNNGHGTNVAAIIASKGTGYAPGFAPGAQIVAVKVLDAHESGFVSDWIAGLDWVRTNLATSHVRIVNMSLGTSTLYGGTCDAQQPLMASAVAQLTAMSVAIFASAGNQGASGAISSPACNSSVIAVGATYKGNVGRQPSSGTYATFFGPPWPACFDNPTTLRTITCFTNSSSRLDIVAPGAPITTYGLDGDQWTYWGTSQASPTAAGTAALMLQVDGAQTPAQILARLKVSGPPVTDPKNGLAFTEIDALTAVQLALSQLTPSASVNQATFAVGQTLHATVGLVNPGRQGAADIYAGTLGPDGTIEFLTGTGPVVGSLADLSSFRPIVTGLSLVSPFAVTVPGVASHLWTGTETHGGYVFFILVVESGAISVGPLTGDKVLGVAGAPYSF